MYQPEDFLTRDLNGEQRMKLYFLLTGCICLFYYIIMWIYSKKWNSTFVLFWPDVGGVHLILYFLVLPKTPGIVLNVLIFCGWVLFVIVEAQIIMAMYKTAGKHCAYLIILGAQVRGTRITSSLRHRLDAALVYLQENQETQVIVSGGQGKGEEISEAEAMAGYLMEHGIEKERIRLENTSTTTWENLKFSAVIIGDLTKPVAVVTNNFHLYRALKIGRRAGYQNLQGIAARSNSLFQVNYMVREFFAVLKFWIMKFPFAKFQVDKNHNDDIMNLDLEQNQTMKTDDRQYDDETSRM